MSDSPTFMNQKLNPHHFLQAGWLPYTLVFCEPFTKPSRTIKVWRPQSGKTTVLDYWFLHLVADTMALCIEHSIWLLLCDTF